MNQARESQTFVARALSTREARRFVAEWLAANDCSAFVARVSLAVSELAANAVLHTARPFTVSAQTAESGVRVEVIDSAPHLVPMRIPTRGTAADLTWLSETGRGLQIVSAVANRWGITLAQNVKTVWAEFDAAEPATPSEPTIDQGPPASPKAANVFHLHFVGLPVRASIASGLDVEEAIRDLLAEGVHNASPEMAELLELVDRTASLRLAGRHAALEASSLDQVHYDLDIDATDDEMEAMGRLNAALAARSRRVGPSQEVTHFREWLLDETQRQRRGEPPRTFPGNGDGDQRAHDEWLWDQAELGYAVVSLDGVVLRANEAWRRAIDTDRAADVVAQVVPRVVAEERINDGRLSAVLARDRAGKATEIRVVVHPSPRQNTDELIRALQQTLIPPAPPIVPGLDVAAVYHPAQGDVGGDFYDVFEVAESDWCAVLGDVSGKGVEAAIVTSTARHAVRSAALREPVPSGLMTALNRALLAKGSTRFCTVTLLRVQHHAGAWVATLTSGGHPYPLLVRHGMATRLGRPGSLLGMFPDVTFHDVSIKLAVGDALVLYTDGVTEARNATGEFFGEDRMHAAIAAAGSSAQAIVDAVLSSVLAFQEGPSDDIALVVIRRPSL